MPLRFWVLFTVTAFACAASLSLAPNPQSAAAQVPPNAANENVASSPLRQPPMTMTPAREAAALKFAEIHHPELAKLLVGLKKRNANAYIRAMRQLYRDSERLARLSDKQPGERYQHALKSWKLDSRIRLLAAQVFSLPNPNPRLKAELDEVLEERVDLQISQLELEHRRLTERLQKLDVSIKQLQNDREAAVKQQLQRVKRSLGLKNNPSRRKSVANSKARKSKTKPVSTKD